MDSTFEEYQPTKTHLIFVRKKRHPDVNSGHGAYRPVINYNEISIHRKKMASKKIICCLLGAGTVIIVFGLILLLLGLYVINRQCPFHWHNISDRCLYVSNHATHTWASARALCLEQGAHMADIETEEENKIIMEQLSGNAWLGLFRERKKTNFEWTTGIQLSYSKWNQTPFHTSPVFTECVKIDGNEGSWSIERSCSVRMYAACEYHKSYYPFVLVGPVMIVCGILVMIMSIEVCKRHRKTSRKGKGLLAHEEEPNIDEKTPEKTSPKVCPVIETDLPPVKKPRLNQTVPVSATSVSKVSRPTSKASSKKAETSFKSPSQSPKVNVVSPASTLNGNELSSYTRTLTPLVDEHSSQELLELMLSPKSFS